MGCGESSCGRAVGSDECAVGRVGRRVAASRMGTAASSQSYSLHIPKRTPSIFQHSNPSRFLPEGSRGSIAIAVATVPRTAAHAAVYRLSGVACVPWLPTVAAHACGVQLQVYEPYRQVVLLLLRLHHSIATIARA